jgi:hypothetical protein
MQKAYTKQNHIKAAQVLEREMQRVLAFERQQAAQAFVTSEGLRIFMGRGR